MEYGLDRMQWATSLGSRSTMTGVASALNLAR